MRPIQTMVQALITEMTCGDACWHAREDVCRCSCGGRNHGCLRGADGEQPARTSRIAGAMYQLVAVQAPVMDNMCMAETLRPIEEQLRLFHSRLIKEGVITHGDIYYAKGYRMDCLPGVLKTATAGNVERWPELAAWRDSRGWDVWHIGPLCLWVRADYMAHWDKEVEL